MARSSSSWSPGRSPSSADHIVLDEPTNHLDIRHQSEVLDIVASQGMTVLAALHDLGLAALYCDRVHLLADGRLHSSGTPADVITAENISAAYQADVLVIPTPRPGCHSSFRGNRTRRRKEHLHAI